MSDSHIYELEDIVWDDFSISDDHLVPFPQIQHEEGSFIQTESHAKLNQHAGVTSSAVSHGAECGVATEKTLFSSPKITGDKVFANGSRSHKTDTGQTYNDLMANSSSEGLDATRGNFISSNNFYTGSDLTNNCTAADNNSFYSLNGTLQSESNHGFLCNGHENKGIDASSLYEWPEIGNYDLPQMLRSCVSSFGQGDQTKKDDMCWFTAINGPDAASHSQVMSSYSDSDSPKIFSGNSESPQPTYESLTVEALKQGSADASFASSTLTSNTTGHSCLSKASSLKELPTNLVRMDNNEPFREVNMHTRNMGYPAQSMETNVPLHQFDSSKLTSKSQRSFSKESHRLIASSCSGLQKQNESLQKRSQSDEHPLEETSFLQLQEVMEQMDLKTKVCIRDSLYRLARSAEQRQWITTRNRAGKALKNSNETLVAGTMQTGLLNIETDTNPIDRSIAHLLFHRPSVPSKMLLSNPRPSRNMNDGAELFRHDDFKNVEFHVAKKEA